MPSEFKTIDSYLSQCHELLSQVKETSLLLDSDTFSDSEQKVPQSLLSDDLEDFQSFGDHEIAGFYPRIHTNAFEDAQKHAPVDNTNCMPVDMSIGHADTFTTNDTYHNSDTTHRILDLDNSADCDVIVSSHNVRIKKELDVDRSYSCANSHSHWNDYNPFCAEVSEPNDPFYYNEFYDSCSSDMESVQTLLINQVKRDITTISLQLGISQDPYTWSEDNVHLWVYFMLQQQKLAVREANNFSTINGRKLCAMSEAEIRFAAPSGGSQIFVQIEIWKNASKIDDSQFTYGMPKLEPDTTSYMSSFSSYNQQTPFSPHNQHHVTSVSPAPSAGSVDSHHSDGSASSSPPGQAAPAECHFDPSEPPTRKQTIHLWQFLKQLLLSEKYPRCIRWLDRSQGIFKIENSSSVAKLWGRRKNRPAMNYDKLSRSIRQYYKKGIIKKTLQSKRLVYQFCRPYLC